MKQYTAKEIEIARAAKFLFPHFKYITQDNTDIWINVPVMIHATPPHVVDKEGYWESGTFHSWSTDIPAYADDWMDSLIDIDEAIKQGEQGSVELRACPCCGGEAILKEVETYNENYRCPDSVVYGVECSECGLETALWTEVEVAKEKWNKRCGH